MKVYVLTINEVESDPKHAIVSSYIAPRYPRNTEFYASRQGAESRQKEIYEGVNKLIGFIHGIEAVIKEHELKP